MMSGVVTPNRQAIVELTLRSTSGQVNTVEAIVDTGFTGSRVILEVEERGRVTIERLT